MARRRDAGTVAGATPEYAEMGDRLRAARLATGVSLRGLAERLNVSASLISQVETGRAKPSVSTLYAIVNALGISLDELLFTDAWSASSAVIRPRPGNDSSPDDGNATGGAGRRRGDGGSEERGAELPGDPVQRAASRAVIRLASGVVWERLTTESIPDVDFLYVTYEVGGASSPEDAMQRHGGREWGYVISGVLGVRVGFDEHVLGPGDAIAFDSSTPHRLYNAGREPVHGVWFVQGRGAPEIAAPPPAGAPRGRSRRGGPVHSH